VRLPSRMPCSQSGQRVQVLQRNCFDVGARETTEKHALQQESGGKGGRRGRRTCSHTRGTEEEEQEGGTGSTGCLRGHMRATCFTVGVCILCRCLSPLFFCPPFLFFLPPSSCAVRA